MVNAHFWKGKKVFLTGHTGFKGSWLTEILKAMGAEVCGYSLEPPTKPNLFEIAKIENGISSVIGDIRDFDKLKIAFDKFQPEIVIHMAAQPLVRESYLNPRYTYDVNVLGTVNILECVCNSDTVKSFLNVTTDKVYLNREWEWGYREDEPLDGFDPYSNSKSCSELVTHSYYNSFFLGGEVAISTARAGNVIGGGDFSTDRIIPDCVRAAQNEKVVVLRNPTSIRPYQHVLEPLFAYLLLAERQYSDSSVAGWYNVGPNESDCVTTAELVRHFCEAWGDGFLYEHAKTDGPHEANFLKLDSSKIKSRLGWHPVWDIKKAVEKTVEWSKAYLSGKDVKKIMTAQIEEYKGATNG